MTLQQTNPAAPRLRADAQRNVEGIRQAALDVFRTHGLGIALEEVARAAGVSKGTIYHRFGGRDGLIDAVVEELVGERINAILTEIESLDTARERFETYLMRIWMLQFDEPAANDVLLRAHPGSRPLAELCERTGTYGAELLAAAQAVGAIRADLTADDLALLVWERGIIARASTDQSGEQYHRRLIFTLSGLRTS